MKHLVPRTVAYPVILVVVFLYLFPMFYLVNVSMKSSNEFLLDPVGIVRHVNLSNFAHAWQEGGFGSLIGNTLFYTVSAVFLSLAACILAAFPVSRKYTKGSNFLYILFLFAIFLPSNLIPQFQLILNLGLYDTRLGYILVNTDLGLGFLLMVGYFKSIPKELDEAASIDGSGYARYVLTIIPVLAKPVLATAGILQAVGVWNNIIGATVYISSKSLFPITLGLFNFYGQYGNDWPLLTAAIVIITCPLVVLYIFLQKYFMEGAMAGAIKA